jgi:prepilin-type N-terminal cleavage/methylation domain-containing protein
VRPQRSGFGLVELLVVMTIVAILARIALPAYHDLATRARAAAAVADLEAVRMAAYGYNADTNEWPADRTPGVVPPELLPYLGPGFSFQRAHYQLDWENWVLPDGTPRYPGTGVLLGVSISTTDPALGQALEELVGSDTAHYTLANNYTFVIAAL